MVYKCDSCGKRYTKAYEQCPNCGSNHIYIDKSNSRSGLQQGLIISLVACVTACALLFVGIAAVGISKNIIDGDITNTSLDIEIENRDGSDDIKESTVLDIAITKEAKDLIIETMTTDVIDGKEYGPYKIKYNGSMRNGKFHGYGELENLETGFIYKGEFVDGQYHGYGGFGNSETLVLGHFENGLYKPTCGDALTNLSLLSDDVKISYNDKIIEILDTNDEMAKNSEYKGEITNIATTSQIKELKKFDAERAGSIINTDELYVMQISSYEFYGMSISELTCLDANNEHYLLIAFNRMGSVYEGSLIKTKSVFLNNTSWNNVGGGTTLALAMAVLDYEVTGHIG